MSRKEELLKYFEQIGNPDPIEEALAIERYSGDIIFPASGNLPVIKLDGLTWDQYARRIAKKKGQVIILDLGAGSDCAAYTGGEEGDKLNPAVKRLHEEGIALNIIGHSRGGHEEWVLSHGINRFLSGHFVDALSQVEPGSIDLVLSRWALYQTMLSTHILGLIDEKLSSQGAAFLETVSRSSANDSILLYREDDLPVPYVNLEDIYRSLPFDKAQVGGLNWQKDPQGNPSTAFRKGGVKKDKLPVLMGTLATSSDYFGHEKGYMIGKVR